MAIAFVGGVNAVSGWGIRDRFRFINTWIAGDKWQAKFTTTSGDFTLGYGNLDGSSFQFLYTYGDRVYLASGSRWNFSSIGSADGWEEQDIGAGEIDLQTSFGFVDQVASFGIIQGRLAVFGRRNIQVWNIDANPDLFSRVQTLQNVGTVASLSVQSIGELDLLFLDDTGIRSLRTKEVSLNAYVTDLGSSIDTIIQGVLQGLSNSQKAVACGIVEPESKRYWLHLNGTLYVLSNFPASEILAWSTYLPSYGKTFIPSTGVNYDGAGHATITGLTIGAKYEWTALANDYSITTAGGVTLTSSGEFTPTATTATVTGKASDSYTGTLKGQVLFTPEKMVVYNGQVYIRSTDGDLLVYGGTNNSTYDCCIPEAKLPWLDMESPTEIKQGLGLDIAQKGKWHCYASMNPRASAPIEVINRGSATTPDVLSDSTFDVGHFPYSAQGTHLQLRFVGDASSVEQKISKLAFLYNSGNQK